MLLDRVELSKQLAVDENVPESRFIADGKLLFSRVSLP